MKWIPLEPSPVLLSHRSTIFAISTPLVLNRNELLLIPTTLSFHHSLYKYNIKENEWKEWIKYPNDMFLDRHTASINKDKKLLYILNRNGDIIEINLKTKEFNTSPKQFNDILFTYSFIIDKQFHFFGQYGNFTSFYKWNDNDKKLIKLNNFHQDIAKKIANKLYLALTIYISSMQSVIIIPSFGKKIYIYTLKTNECKEIINNKLLCLKYRTAIITKNEQFIILFGSQEYIGILNVKCMKIRISNIQSPSSKQIQPLYATIVNDDIMDEILVFGFIRKCWNDTKFNNIQYLPIYLIKLIGKSYCMEIMYYVEIQKGLHWKINIDDILR